MKTKNLTLSGLAVIVGFAAMPASAAAPHWDYEEQAIWGQLQDTSQTIPPLMYPFAECSIGTHQSPVDLGGEIKAKSLNKVLPKYTQDTPDFYNSGHAVQVNTSSGYKGILKIGQDEYPLIQYHFHSPSEHVIGSETFPAEVHYVHIRGDGKIAVLGVMLKEGAENPAFQTILDNTPTTAGTHNANSGIKLDPAALLPKNRKHFYTYAGSLTTPPCSEGVNWYVLAQPVTVSAEQIAQLEKLYEKNNRLPQNLNGRTVTGNVR
jgi:carbonic anhydrase